MIWKEELTDLCEAAIEGQLTAVQLTRLEQLVLDDPQAKRFYVEYLHQHACLHWSAADPSCLVGEKQGHPQIAPVQPKARISRRWVCWGMSLAALIAVVVGLGLGIREIWKPPLASVATLSSSKSCKWEGATLPTEVGARLGAGRLRLAEGLARVVFDSGAEVTLEGPADLELISPKRCVLHGGRLVAKVPPAAYGFIVDTPTAVLKDLGTEFGVNVKDEQTADVQVFNGQVDVQHRSSGRLEHMRTGKNLRFGPNEVEEFDPLSEKSLAGPAAVPLAEAARLVQISTAMGHGKDAYVQPLYPSPNSSDILLLVKHTVDKHANYDRKAYLGMDLAPIAGMTVVEAQLSLTYVPTGLGFASEVPDATFTLYGLTDESLDDWNEKTIRWNTAPANRPGGAALDPEKVVRLGTFEIMQGVLRCTRGISGQALVDFLNRDTNGLATFILVRETKGSGRTDLVHGFANKHHPQYPPPTLKLTVVPRKS